MRGRSDSLDAVPPIDKISECVPAASFQSDMYPDDWKSSDLVVTNVAVPFRNSDMRMCQLSLQSILNGEWMRSTIISQQQA